MGSYQEKHNAVNECKVVMQIWVVAFYTTIDAGLKLKIQKTKVMASGPITAWQIDWETMETVRDFILGGSKITADGDLNHDIKIRLLLRKKAMTNLDSKKAETLLCQQRSI